MLLFFFFVMPFAALLYSYDKSLGLLLGALYAIHLYTKESAKSFLKAELKKIGKAPPGSGSSAEAHINEGPKLRTFFTGRRPEAAPQAPAASFSPPPEARVIPLYVAPKPAAPLEPNFEGLPHEVLAISETASKNDILHAFRHWLQVYHPDHHPGEDAGLYTERTRRLSEARDAMLAARKARLSKAA